MLKVQQLQTYLGLAAGSCDQVTAIIRIVLREVYHCFGLSGGMG